MKTIGHACAMLLLAGAIGVAHQPPPSSAPARVRVLFIGNSLTASNDLPAMVQAMARLRGIELQYEACTPGGVSLEDHWNDGRCRTLLDERPWDFVVLQQGPSSRDDSRANLKEWSARWADASRARGARPALYMVWPQRGQRDGFRRVSDSYALAATGSRALLLPVGDAWRSALEAGDDVPLYSQDGLHPTETGTYLAALVVAKQLAGVAPADVPDRLRLASGRTVEVKAGDGAKLRSAASKVLAQQ